MFVSEFIDYTPKQKLFELFIGAFPTSSDYFMWKNGCGEYDDNAIWEAYKEYINEVVKDINLRRAICSRFGEDGEVQEFLEALDELFEDDIKAKYEELENEGFVCEGTEPLPKLLVEKNDIRTQLEEGSE
jgi:hypothetical protein